MAVGDVTLTNFGDYNVSGSALKTQVDSLNIDPLTTISGSQIYIIPIGNGQVTVLQTVVAKT